MQQYISARKQLKLKAAFSKDGWKVQDIFFYGKRMGIRAVHKTIQEYESGEGKRSYYVEGTPYERGCLLGMMAEASVAEMTTRFADSVIFDFLNIEIMNSFPLLQRLMVEFLYELSESVWTKLPAHISEEIDGILAGCKSANPHTAVTKKRLVVINVAFDVLCALVYSGDFFRQRFPMLNENSIRLTMMCNAFSIFGDAAGGGHFFARDFMFATGGVFQNNLCHVIHAPAPGPGAALHPYISVTAPGIVGSISGMNDMGVAIGVNMSPGANSDPRAVGENSLLLARDAIMYGGSAYEAADFILRARRGVAWNYALSDGAHDTACTVEAGASGELDCLSFPPPQVKPFLPSAAFFAAHPDAPLTNGGMVRWSSVPFPKEYFAFNPGLWRQYRVAKKSPIMLLPGAFSLRGFINRTPMEKNCPSTFYFAPQRTPEGIHITGNHFLLPSMRLCAMDPWTEKVVRSKVNDIQWRYDILNALIYEMLEKEGAVSFEGAKKLADFLAPYGRFPEYYAKNPKSPDGKDTRIEGCVSLFDLKSMTVDSHYGYYGDRWIRTTLPLYL